ncbi:MAG: low molecular weight phosphotyrosine protein phosphatase [Lachnospiraceae bacterium]|nr:low molecular weight phosphotyrosine protein phosphatase [Lachnospiraceae bacterium]
MARILFICLGNICRSVAAEYIMKEIVRREGVEKEFFISSAGTSAEEAGAGMYPPMYRELEKAGVAVGNHRATRMKRGDYGKYDLLIGMDAENLYDMKRIWNGDPEGKIYRLMDFTDTPGNVSDPWYTRDFARAYRDIRCGCEALYRKWVKI